MNNFVVKQIKQQGKAKQTKNRFIVDNNIARSDRLKQSEKPWFIYAI